VRRGADLDFAGDTLVLSLGQFKGEAGVQTQGAQSTGGVQRLYDQMSFGAYYSDSPDRNAASILTVDGTLDPTAGTGSVKVAASDASGVQRVVVAFTGGDGRWESADLAFDDVAQKWSGVITATAATQFFVQVADAAGNVAVNDNKGRYYALIAPVPLATGRSIGARIYLPAVVR
jgi:hypothetical protein